MVAANPPEDPDGSDDGEDDDQDEDHELTSAGVHLHVEWYDVEHQEDSQNHQSQGSSNCGEGGE